MGQTVYNQRIYESPRDPPRLRLRGCSIFRVRSRSTSPTRRSPKAQVLEADGGVADSSGNSGQVKTACDPCLFFFSQRGCSKSFLCGYCHLDHAHTQPPAHRPRKQARERYKRSVCQLLQSQQGVEHVHDQLQEIARKNPYLRNFFQGFLDNPDNFNLTSDPGSTGSVSSTQGAQSSAPMLRQPGPQPYPSHHSAQPDASRDTSSSVARADGSRPERSSGPGLPPKRG